MEHERYLGLRINRIAIAFLVGIFLAILISIQLNYARSMPQLPKFSGSYIAAISDGDFLASTYDNGKLPAPGVTDRLSILPLPFNGKQESIARINTSNSVIGVP
ncbi:hypothetical protein [Chamaesiphon polymorphus]|nr:hypothetical protein [Chamaesiphon polymorphus]